MIKKEEIKAGQKIMRIPLAQEMDELQKNDSIGRLFEIVDDGVNFMTLRKYSDKSTVTEYFNYDGKNKKYDYFEGFAHGDVLYDNLNAVYCRTIDNSLDTNEVTVINEKGKTYSIGYDIILKIYDKALLDNLSKAIKTPVIKHKKQANTSSSSNLNLSSSIKGCLRRIIKDYGIEICNKRYDLEHILTTSRPNLNREINLILTSCRAQIPQYMFKMAQTQLDLNKLEEFTNLLFKDYFISLDAANWIMDMWTSIFSSLDTYEKNTEIIDCEYGKYIGEIDDQLFNGQGIFKYNTGDIYYGEWLDGIKLGSGVLEYEDGSKYIGEFTDDKINGYGILITPDGKKCVGTWKNGELVKEM
jgi:hypothetical protein